MITFKQRGSFKKVEKFLTRNQRLEYTKILDKYGREGAAALKSATPADSGETAGSWDYEVKIFRNSFSIMWTNSNIVNGVPIAVILQYGHATRNGGYVQGRDYINPALKPVFDRLAEEVWKEVINL